MLYMEGGMNEVLEHRSTVSVEYTYDLQARRYCGRTWS